MEDRRRAKRVEVALNARWEGASTSRQGTVVNLSMSGCFIWTPSKVDPQEPIRLEIQLPKEGSLYLPAEVVYRIGEVGFAVRFTGTIDAEQRKILEWLIAAEERRSRGRK